jgi:hypothetical protein
LETAIISEKCNFQDYNMPHSGAGEESRTLDLNLGKVALYQLSYSRFAMSSQQAGIIDDLSRVSRIASEENSIYSPTFSLISGQARRM